MDLVEPVVVVELEYMDKDKHFVDRAVVSEDHN